MNEGGEIVSAQVSDIQGAFCLELCASWATILDDDNLPGLSVSNAGLTEVSGGF